MRLALLLLIGCGKPATFTEVRDDILVPTCGFDSCHGSGTSGLTMDPENPGEIYANLVNAKADTGKTLVVPGDSSKSYLFQKVAGEGGIDGNAMPPPDGLDADALAKIESWIEAGAEDN